MSTKLEKPVETGPTEEELRAAQEEADREAALKAEEEEVRKLEAESNKKKRGRSSKRNSKIRKTQDMHKSMQNRIDRINKFTETTRWLPDSAFTTYFGKPAFHAYGMGNTNPTYGGPIYGNYLLSHSINPECGTNKP